MAIKLNIIAAACENMGIGLKGKLPWKLKSEMAHFKNMTLVTKDPKKKNAVVMGRSTWDSIPANSRPLTNRINIVLSRNPDFKINNKNVIVCESFDVAMEKLSQLELNDEIESVWVIGGSLIYDTAMKSKYLYRIYLTEIKANFECDIFMPPLPKHIKLVEDPRVPVEEMEENGIKYVINVYESTEFDS